MIGTTGVERGAAIIDKTFDEVLKADRFTSIEAKCLLLAIGLQESEFKYRIQKGNGPAHSFWQEERNGIRAAMHNSSTAPYLKNACQLLGVEFTLDSIYAEVVNNDELACVVARLLLYADPRALPVLGDINGAWLYYLDNWRPGRPRPEDWPDNYKKALEYING